MRIFRLPSPIRSNLRFAAMVLATAAALLGALPATAQILIENVTVLPFTGDSALPGASVYVEGDRIVAVGSDMPASAAAAPTKIDGSGKFLMPGMTEMHGHIPPPEKDSQYLADTLFLFVARGVTTVRSMLGFSGHIELKKKIASGEVFGPSLYVASPGFSRGTARSPEQAAALVAQFKADGWDLIKVFNSLPRDNFEAVMAQAKAFNIDVAGHVPYDVGIDRALASGMRTIEHLDGYMISLGGEGGILPDAVLRDAALRTKTFGVGVVPTMAVWKFLERAQGSEVGDTYPELAYVPPALLERWRARDKVPFLERMKTVAKSVLGKRDADAIVENRRRLLTFLGDADVEILFGSDSPQLYSVPGFSVIREMRAMAESGLTNRKILESATSAPGVYFADRDNFGVIRPGARADMVMLSADPLQDLESLARPEGVMLRGRWIGAGEIDAGLAEIAGRYAEQAKEAQ